MGQVCDSGRRPDGGALRSAPGRDGRTKQSNSRRALFAALTATALSACSLHPIPDDVSPIPTEAIVAAARCELRLGLVDMVKVWFADESPSVTGLEADTIAEHLKEMKKRFPKVDLETDWNEYMDIAVAYDWTFDITETNHADAGVGFKLPFINPGSLDAGAGGTITTTRQGKRTFKSQDKFSNLLRASWRDFCNDKNRSIAAFLNTPGDGRPFSPRDPNFIYPVTGTIGLRKAVTSFLKIAAQEGALDTFTDELTFTTTVDANAGAGVTLSPVPKEFRLVSASANVTGHRMDLHKVQISLAFPKARPAQKTKNQLVAELQKEMDVRGGYHLNPNWRATYALCVVDGRGREAEFKTLRWTPPEVSCLDSTDALFPRGDGVKNHLLTGRSKDLKDLEEERDERERALRSAVPPGSVAPPRLQDFRQRQ